MAFLIGALGAAAVFGLFALGVFAGWKARGRHGQLPKAEKASDRELRALKAQQEAFRQLQHYSADVAYGIGQDRVEEVED